MVRSTPHGEEERWDQFVTVGGVSRLERSCLWPERDPEIVIPLLDMYSVPHLFVVEADEAQVDQTCNANTYLPVKILASCSRR